MKKNRIPGVALQQGISARRRLGRWLRRSGLMPWVFRARIAMAPWMPRAIVGNLFWFLRREKESLPLPSARARFLVAGTAEIGVFIELGRLAASSIEEALRRHDYELGQFPSILDFGCGSGRVLRHWGHLDSVSVLGAEMNEELVEECRRSVPFARVLLNRPQPPLELPPQSLDLVYSLSVFTHLDEELQRRWRDELLRVLKVGGLLLFTTHGEHYLSRLNEEERASFRAGNCVIHGAEFLGENLCITYHSEDYVRRILAQGFEVLEFVPEGALGNPRQDLYLFRKRG